MTTAMTTTGMTTAMTTFMPTAMDSLMTAARVSATFVTTTMVCTNIVPTTTVPTPVMTIIGMPPVAASVMPCFTMMGLIPRMMIPVVTVTPLLPVAVEVTVGYTMISGRHAQDIIRWNRYYWRWNSLIWNAYPGPSVKLRLEPKTFMVSIPKAILKIKPRHIRHQIDIRSSTGNHDGIGRCRKAQWWWVLLSRANNWNAENKTQRNYK